MEERITQRMHLPPPEGYRFLSSDSEGHTYTFVRELPGLSVKELEELFIKKSKLAASIVNDALEPKPVKPPATPKPSKKGK